jgi:hypothetical protein
MRMSRLATLVLLVVFSIVGAARAAAQPDTGAAQAIREEVDRLKKEFDARLAALEARLDDIEAGTAVSTPTAQQPAVEVPPGAAGAAGPTGTLPVYGNVTAATKIFNPDIAVIGNFLAAAGTNDVKPEPALQIPESELSLQAIVDPYARADFFLAFGEEGVDLEEGYVTFPTLPGGLLAKVGKMRSAFGKINTLHTHMIPWVDRPLVTQNLLGGAEGLSDAGLSVARLIANPWFFLEATGQLFRGDAGGVFVSSQRSDVSFTGHVRGYHDLTESANVDVGASYAYGRNGSGLEVGRDYATRLVGIDAVFRWRPLRRSIYRSFMGRSEFVWSDRDQPDGRQRAIGMFVSGDYQLARRWFTGVRFDRSDRAHDQSLRDAGVSWTLTYWPSEFSQVRTQLRRTNYAEGSSALESLFQVVFDIGAHGAHPF